MANKLIRKLCMLLIATAFLSCKNDRQQDQHHEEVESYQTITVNPQKTTIHTDFPVTLKGIQDVEIRPKVNGFIADILVDEGQKVSKGQLLFRLFAPEYEEQLVQSQAAIQSIEAEMEEAKLQIEKTKPLVQEGVIGKYELESAQHQLKNKTAQLNQAKSVRKSAEVNVEYTQIRAPFDGVMDLVPYKKGSLVSSSSPNPLTRISDISRINAYFSINEKQFFDWMEKSGGKSVSDYINEQGEINLILPNNQLFNKKGIVDMVSGQVDPKTGSIVLRAIFPNPDQVLRSGNSAKLRVYEKLDSALIIPQRATVEIQGNRFVYKVDGEGMVTSVAVDLWDHTPSNEYFIVKSGLIAGDRIIAEGVAGIREGVKIKTTTK
ncbi:efflux RND transporter periplasmic adaptor subunit [Sphingobacterium sp. UT-1RO-CII-1]|uniref:efflux RND transporter periplasmic adaptor subunit n=1 Tax=Sphingobacterium sp. UT-1RO-CII-1 TaxID=2995225 RepID=UPI00227AAA8E|nr:efflux RND transporter periplasmic adaptor subunit [Sphingobacterium sp. UT-1RO-CII-1]MCY4779251.1 efflux RND transporter periplasmic adaptor subunit [Sphingobacterium sp. UT-1RO-CII-1]